MSTPAHEFDDELLSAYLDNEVTAAERALVEERLRTDERARQLLDDLRFASHAVKSLPRPLLGRDLTAAVLNEIERQDPTVDAARILTMPVRDQDTVPHNRASGSRGLVWASLAVAAALLLMFLRNEEQAPRIATGPGDKSIDASEGEGGATALESTTPAGRGADDSAMIAAAPGASKVDSPDATARRGVGEGGESAPTRVPRTPGSRGMTETPPSAAADANNPSAATAEAVLQPAAAIHTINLAVAGDDIAATFQKALADAEIELVDEELTSELAAGVADARTGEATDEAEAADAYLVEATPAQIAAVTAAFDAVAPATRPADGPEAALAEVRGADSPRGRAWRTTAARRQTTAATESDAAAATEPGALFGGGGGRYRDEAVSADRVRVLFLLRPTEQTR